MSLPLEIVEIILLKCDGKSFLNAKKVCQQWQDLGEYLENKTKIWEWCCKEEIPPKELVEYTDSYDKNDVNVWFHIYRNWLAWQDMDFVQFDTILSPVEIPRITCIDVAGNVIAVGSEDGRVRIFDQFWKQLYVSRHQAEKVNKVTFFYSGYPKMCKMWFVIAYPKVLVFDHLQGHDGINYTIIEDVKAHSIYKDHICYQKNGGRLTIERFIPEEIFLRYVWFTRIYSPSNITCLNLWNGFCTVLINNEVKEVNYAENVNPMANLEPKARLKFSFDGCMTSVQHQIIRDNVVIVLYKDLMGVEYMEIIILENENYVKKLFNTCEVLEASITCIYLFGNTLVIGVDSGIVYFYHLPCWKQFHIKEYQKKIIIGKHPITNIVVKEGKGKRKFYVTSSFDIHEVTGFSPINL